VCRAWIFIFSQSFSTVQFFATLGKDRNGFSKIKFQQHEQASQEGSLRRTPLALWGQLCPGPQHFPASGNAGHPSGQTCPGPRGSMAFAVLRSPA